MISEDYVSFETAKLLRENGFNEKVICYYDDGGSLNLNKFVEFQCCNQGHGSSIFAAPTLQMAMKWMRIEHNIHIEPHIVRTKCSYGYMPNYINLKELKPHFPFDEFDFANADKYVCLTPDKACEVTLKYCLEHLI